MLKKDLCKFLSKNPKVIFAKIRTKEMECNISSHLEIGKVETNTFVIVHTNAYRHFWDNKLESSHKIMLLIGPKWSLSIFEVCLYKWLFFQRIW